MDIKTLSHSDIVRMFGTIDDHRILEIIELLPSEEDLEVAMAYLAGMSDVMGEEREPLSGIAADIYEIVSRDEPSEEEEAGLR